MSNNTKGYLKLFPFKAMPIFIHWFVPVAGLMISAYVGFNWEEALYYGIAFVVLITVHELGHALTARALGHKVYAIYISFSGGYCTYDKPENIRDELWITSAGVLAQVVLLILTLLYTEYSRPPTSLFVISITQIFIILNFIFIIISIVPHKGLDGTGSDGYMFWKICLHILRDDPYPKNNNVAMDVADIVNDTVVFPPDTSLLALDQFNSVDFIVGLEILNDDTTPMEFVVEVLEKYIGIPAEEAVQFMLLIHTHGGVLIDMDRMESAQLLASNISKAAEEKGHKFICRAVHSLEPGSD